MSLYILFLLPPAVIALYLFYKSFGRQKKDYHLLREVLEASRGARLVVNHRNENLFLNSKFRAFCTPFGAPSYP